MEESAKLPFCLSVIDRYRQELPSLRRALSVSKRQREQGEQKANYWQEQYQSEQQRNQRLIREKSQLEVEIEQLKQEIERLTKTKERYRVSLFDHGNFTPTSPSGKAKGGQQGHTDTNREAHEDMTLLLRERVFVTHCLDCGHSLSRVSSTVSKRLLDIVLNPTIVNLIIDRERQWCGHCHKATVARDTRSLPFTEYGLNTFMLILLLRYRCLLPFSKIALVLTIGYGLPLSGSAISNLLTQAKDYLGPRYQELKRLVREGGFMYNDETGWQVKGRNAWMWLAANHQVSVYLAAESRGSGIAKELYGNSQAYSMHDGLASYGAAIPKGKHLYCWAHLLRFAHEETINAKPHTKSVMIRDKLVLLYHLKKRHQGKELAHLVRHGLDALIGLPTTEVSAQKLIHRVSAQKEGLIRALVNSPNGTNNLAEQELRPVALARKVSFGSNTFKGMETTAVNMSIVQTISRNHAPQDFFPTMATVLREGFVKS